MLIFFFFFFFFFLLRVVSLAHPVLALFLSGEFLLHIPCLHYFSVGSFSYTSRAGFFFFLLALFRHTMLPFYFIFLILGVSITHPVLAFTCGEFLLHIPCWLYIYLGSFSYTSRSGFIFICGVSLTHPTLALIFCREFLTHPMLAFYFLFFFIFYSGEFLLHIPCWLHFYAGSFADSSRTGFISIWGVSLTHPILALFFEGGGGWRGRAGALIKGSLSYTSHAGFFFLIWGVSLPDPVLASFLCGEFLLHIPYWLYFLSREFLLHIPCLLYFSVGSFSYTSHTGFIFIWGVSLTHPMLAFCVGSFSYTSHAGFL